MTTDEYEIASIHRSPIHGTTWVPMVDGGDNYSSINAGPQRTVKAYVEEQCSDQFWTRWVVTDPDQLTLLASDSPPG